MQQHILPARKNERSLEVINDIIFRLFFAVVVFILLLFLFQLIKRRMSKQAKKEL
jgi:glycopeptide antibiotics resistance protein